MPVPSIVLLNEEAVNSGTISFPIRSSSDALSQVEWVYRSLLNHTTYLTLLAGDGRDERIK